MEATRKLSSDRNYLKRVDWRFNSRPDVCVLCTDGELRSHRILLCHVSSLIREIIADDAFKGTDIAITIPDLTCEQLNKLLDLAYKGEVKFQTAAEMREFKKNMKFLGWLPGAKLDELIQRPVSKSTIMTLPKICVKSEKLTPPEKSYNVSEKVQCKMEKISPVHGHFRQEVYSDCDRETLPTSSPPITPVKRTWDDDGMDSPDDGAKKKTTPVKVSDFVATGNCTSPSVTHCASSSLKPIKRIQASVEERQQPLKSWMELKDSSSYSDTEDSSSNSETGDEDDYASAHSSKIKTGALALQPIPENSPSVVRSLFQSTSTFKTPTSASREAEVSKAIRKTLAISMSQPVTPSTRQVKTNLSRRSPVPRTQQSQSLGSSTSTPTKIFSCPDEACLFSSNNVNYLKRHIELQHPSIGKKICYQCFKVFKTKRTLDEHRLKLFSSRCRVCTKCFCGLRELKKHSKVCQKLMSSSPGTSELTAFSQR